MNLMYLLFTGIFLNLSSMDPFDYEKAWAEVKALTENGMQQDALNKTKEIYDMAAKESNHLQRTKATVHLSTLTIASTEDGVVAVDAIFQKEIAIQKTPYKQILNHYYARFLNNYFENNRYIISQRTETNDENLLTMTSQALTTKIKAAYGASVEDSDLLKVDVQAFAPLLNEYNEEGRMRHPQLYELLANDYLVYIMNHTNEQATVSTPPVIDKPFFRPAEEFIKLEVKGNDESAEVIRMFQAILTHEWTNNKLVPLAHFDYLRMNYIYGLSQHKDKNEYYETSLKNAIVNYKNLDIVSEYKAALADLTLNSDAEQGQSKAKSICEDCLKAHPKTQGAQRCQAIINQIIQKELNVVIEQAYATKSVLKFGIRTRNVAQVYYKVIPFSGDEIDQLNYQNYDTHISLFNAKKSVANWSQAITLGQPYREVKTLGQMPVLPAGSYALIISDAADFSGAYQYAWFQVTDLAYISSQDDQGQYFLIVDRMSGKPVPKAQVTFIQHSYDYSTQKYLTSTVGTATSDKHGRVNGPVMVNTQLKLLVKKGKDVFDGRQFHYFGERRQAQGDYSGVEIYTDRSVYRPGQVAYFKILALKFTQYGKPSIEANKKVTVQLTDANGQQVTEQHLVTNEYGTASSTFTLPMGRLTGQYYISTENGGRGILVEEYKRPTFEVIVDTIAKDYKIGDNVVVTGKVKAYAGNQLSNAKVQYTIFRRTIMPYCYWWYPHLNNDKIVASGQTTSDDNGQFTISFDAIDDGENNFYPIYHYEMAITAIDQTGESQATQYTLPISKRSMFIEAGINPVIDKKDDNNAVIRIVNVSGKLLAAKGQYSIYKLKEEKQVQEEDTWREYTKAKIVQPQIHQYAHLPIEKEVKKSAYESGQNLDIASLPVGIYKLVATTDNGQADTLTTFFVVTDMAAKKMPMFAYVHHRMSQAIYNVNDKVSIDLLAPADKQQVYYILSRGGKVLKQQWLSNMKSAKIEHTITEADKGGLLLQYVYIYRNKSYNQSIGIEVPWSDKDLLITYEQFRDKLMPGEQADFKIKISGKNKDKFQAELVAAMYDASLDAIQGHQWNRILFPGNYNFMPLESHHFGNTVANELNYSWRSNEAFQEYTEPIYPALLGMEYMQYYSGAVSGVRTRAMKMESATPESADNYTSGIQAGDVAMDASAPAAETTANRTTAKEASPQSAPPVLTPRTNLNETVFFYPHLKTDANGQVIIAFKMNEALTRWKLMTMAHTKDLATAYDEKFIQTKKDVMIITNSPRFIRQGDEIAFTARISNLTDREIMAVASLDLNNAQNNTSLNPMIKSNQSLQVKLKAGESQSIAWTINASNVDADLLKYTVSAVSGNFTDGESSLLPILSNKILVTSTMALSLKGKEKKTIQFEALKNATATQKPVKYTFEMSSHPIWYAIQAMPYVMDQDNLSASQLAGKYFVNGLSKYIVGHYPQIEEVFSKWQNEQGDALKSNLEKNGELKNALLEESPWVREAQQESNSKANIARIFDVNNVNADLKQTAEALAALRLPDGSYTWFPGGRTDHYTTIYVAEMLGRSAKYDESGMAIEMARPTITYMDLSLNVQYKKWVEQCMKTKMKLEEYQPSVDEIQHLFVRSLFANVSVIHESTEAYNYYTKQALKYWNKYDLYTQSLLGTIDLRNKGKAYKEMVTSIMQRSFSSNELGIYWNAGNGYRWYELPIERHAAIMEFLHEANHDAAALDEMKIWLLKNKQGNHWNTSKSTASAIAALLLTRGPKQANLDNDLSVMASIGHTSLPNGADIQAGTAYYKKSWSADKIDASMATIQLSNPNDNIAWGAAYYQYFDDISKVTSGSASPLQIEKQLYKEVTTSTGKQLVKLNGDQALQPGDVMVSRLIITTDRDMDYIHIKDLRGSGLEPSSNKSGYHWSGAFGYYESIRDLASHYFIDHLPKGKHVFESRQKTVHRGRFSGGLATIQSFYAPEFGGKTEGNVIEVK